MHVVERRLEKQVARIPKHEIEIPFPYKPKTRKTYLSYGTDRKANTWPYDGGCSRRRRVACISTTGRGWLWLSSWEPFRAVGQQARSEKPSKERSNIKKLPISHIIYQNETRFLLMTENKLLTTKRRKQVLSASAPLLNIQISSHSRHMYKRHAHLA